MIHQLRNWEQCQKPVLNVEILGKKLPFLEHITSYQFHQAYKHTAYKHTAETELSPAEVYTKGTRGFI